MFADAFAMTEIPPLSNFKHTNKAESQTALTNRNQSILLREQCFLIHVYNHSWLEMHPNEQHRLCLGRLA